MTDKRFSLKIEQTKHHAPQLQWFDVRLPKKECKSSANILHGGQVLFVHAFNFSFADPTVTLTVFDSQNPGLPLHSAVGALLQSSQSMVPLLKRLLHGSEAQIPF